ncbi:hypothetical protein EVA_03749 [gut metagenome]|uniref:Uncharacterized protein n=1 Tax=gut metagenome TaxID=749906 RepID=J9H3C7_9ZZZZ
MAGLLTLFLLSDSLPGSILPVAGSKSPQHQDDGTYSSGTVQDSHLIPF